MRPDCLGLRLCPRYIGFYWAVQDHLGVWTSGFADMTKDGSALKL